MLSSILNNDNKTVEKGKQTNEPILKSNEFLKENALFRGKFDTYSIVRQIGRGGIGSVYLVKPKSDASKQYAMKIVTDLEDIEREEEVLQVAANSNSIHLCKIFDSGAENGLHFVVLDLLGSNLFALSNHCSTKMKYKLAEQALIAIEAFHTLGFIHRDIKSDNFALGRKGSETEYVVFIIDFGMCRKLEGDDYHETKGESFRGTRNYGSIDAKKGLRIGRKHDLESWFYMVAEWFMGIRQMPWQKSIANYLELKEQLRDDTSTCFKEFFGKTFEILSEEFVKILRYIDSLKTDEKPDYNRILYFLQQAYQRECKELDEEDNEIIAKIKIGRGIIAPPENLVFFSRIDYNNKRNKFRNVEYRGISLGEAYVAQPKGASKPTHVGFKCKLCNNGQDCGLKVVVEYNDEAKLWDEAKVLKIQGEIENCTKFKKLSGNEVSEDAEELKSGDKLESWKIVSTLESKNMFKVINIKKKDTIGYALKAFKSSTNLEKFRNEKTVLMEISKSTTTKLCNLYHDGESLGYSFFVMTLLGPDLEKIRSNAVDKKFTLGTTFSLGIECIEAIEQLHSVGFIHNKISSKAFAVGLNGNSRVLLFDFKSATKIIPLKESGEKPKFEDLFKPDSCCFASYPLPKDDLESLCYTMILFINGHLPYPDVKEQIPQLRQSLEGIPPEITYLKNYVKCLPNSSKIDYALMKTVIMEGLKNRGITNDFYEIINLIGI